MAESMKNESEFCFIGKAPLSKSLLNRACIVKSWFPSFDIQGTSHCDDIQVMERAIQNLKKPIDCQFSASAFRFLALRLSRIPGEHFLTGEPQLLKRPMGDLTILLSQLGVEAKKEEKGWRIFSKGWIPQGDYINIPYKVTSQYASGLVLNGWDLKKDLFFSINRNQVSLSYFKMTVEFVRKLGMTVMENEGEYCIPKKQTVKIFEYKPEQDLNCLFTLAAMAVLRGQAVFLDWKENSLQPEVIFPEILKNMGVSLKKDVKDNKLSIFKTEKLNPIEINLNSYPDLFPVLAVLCSKAQGESHLSGLEHLAFKESHRLERTEVLLLASGVKIKKTEGSFIIYGPQSNSVDSFEFDSFKDHRMVMAGTVLEKTGVPISILGKESVNKSFPEFFRYVY